MYVVDGYNLLHALKKLPGALPADFGRARARVVELFSHLCKREGGKARVFFDGTPGELGAGDLAYPHVKVQFCGAGRESADEAVRDYVENSNQPRRLTVISSDLAVTKACKLAGTKILSSQAMANKLAAATPDSPTPTRPEKPARGAIGKLEQEMLDEIGDFEEFKRRITDG
ncbi:MAG: NYN domain-containing protein [Planctomycetes bacterium]|nr:NYN domain-containing protein [Planctomycetota bacterium]